MESIVFEVITKPRGQQTYALSTKKKICFRIHSREHRNTQLSGGIELPGIRIVQEHEFQKYLDKLDAYKSTEPNTISPGKCSNKSSDLESISLIHHYS